MLEHTLSVRWQLSEPPVTPRAWKSWNSALTHGAGQASQDERLEAGLGWPSGTLAVLRQAFQLHLGRGTGWESDNPAVAMAARVYKRGVAYRDPDGVFTPVAKQGQYQLKLWQEMPDPLIQMQRPGAPRTHFTIIDANVAKHWPAASDAKQFFTISLDEHNKTLEAAALILEAAVTYGSLKTWRIIGGGLLTDVAAFAAGLVGAQVEFVPTTLLAMVDACVGGKTGVNFAPFGKNQVGLFHFPKAVHVWAGWLATLPERELMAGGAECLKHSFLSGDLRLARNLATALRDGDHQTLASYLPAVIGFKAEIVSEDPGEVGRRAILNFGHTMAHALEGYAQSHTSGEVTLRHGEAVGLGLLFAVLLSHRVADLPGDSAFELVSILYQAGCILPAETVQERLGVSDLAAPDLLDALVQLISHDKKNTVTSDTTAEWILISGPGKVAQEGSGHWTVSVFMSDLQPVWRDFLRILNEGESGFTPIRRRGLQPPA